ncbi:MAG TPA: cell division protein FtsA [Treponema sp.]|nr:cell division protein FtsA [Treponema sp.]
MNNIVVGLDLGTSFVRAVIGEVLDDNRVEIIGIAQKPSTGLRNGVIVNRESAMDCIKNCIEEAEQKAGYEVLSCVTAIGGLQIESVNSTGLVAIATHGKGPREINRNDIERVLDAANAVNIPMDRKMLHVIPQNYIVDDQTSYKNPLGTIAVRLSAEVHIVTASKTAIANITQCIEHSGYRLDNVMLKTLAAMHAVMAQDERELGSVLIDLGGGTTDVIVINKDAPICTVSIPVGGKLVTNDISIVKGVSPATAEQIKIQSGCCWLGLIETDDEVIIPGAGGRDPEVSSRTEICQIIEPRMREIFTMVKDQIVNRANTTLAGNIILTGGGALMPGAVQLAEDVFGTTAVRLGIPGDFGGLQEEYRKPDYATAVGLVVGSINQLGGEVASDFKRREEKSSSKGSAWSRFLKKFF